VRAVRAIAVTVFVTHALASTHPRIHFLQQSKNAIKKNVKNFLMSKVRSPSLFGFGYIRMKNEKRNAA
jgi:hypothetical protein